MTGHTIGSSASVRHSRIGIAAGVAAAAALLLQGCSSGFFYSDEEALHLSTPSQRHAIGLQTARAHLDVEVPPASDGFSPNQQSDVLSFLDRYQAEATGPLRISLPGGTRGSAVSGQLRAMAMETGVAPNAIRVERHGGGAGGFVRLSYPRRQVVPPTCGNWPEDLGRNHERINYENFGCATQRNLALNVANPRDLQGPQHETPSSSEKRSANWGKYIGTPVGTPGAASSDAAASSKAGGSKGAQGAGTAAATTK
jgi:pilus assembly protein CpaD